MPIFSYQALQTGGDTVQGRIEAEDEESAVERLQRMGYTPLQVSRVKQSPLKKALQMGSPVDIGEKELFTRQLAAMLEAGIPLTRALSGLSEQVANRRFAEIIESVAEDIQGGASFSESLQSHPDVFPQTYIDMVSAGEVSGNLAGVLIRLAEQMERDKSLRDDIRSAVMYPAVVLVFAVVVLLGMLFFVVPIFVDMFPPGVSLPLPTRIIMGFSNSLRTMWYAYFGAALVLILGLRLYLASEQGSRVWDRMKFKLPIFGELFKKTTIARFARTLATLLSGGIPIIRALETAGPTSGSIQMMELVEDAKREIREGANIADPLKDSSLFPPMVVMMISVGEETGQLSALLNRVAQFYEAEVATLSRGLTSLIEPILIIVVGGLVGGMVISLYLPLFTVITQLG